MSQLVDSSPILTESPERADEDAATLYDCYGARIRAYCHGQLRDRQEVDDAVQSTFLYAFTLLRRGEAPRRPLPWLYTIAHNVCRTRRRALKRRSRVESTVDLDSVQETIGRNDPTHEDLAQLANSLAALPLSQRTALLLREWQGLTYSEIAVELGLTESAVEAVLFRARRNLARKLQYVSDRAATVAGAVLLLPSLRRLSPFGPAARTATATAVLVGTAAFVPFADAPRPNRAAVPAVAHPSPSAARSSVLPSANNETQSRITTRQSPINAAPAADGAEPHAPSSVPSSNSAPAGGSAAPTLAASPAPDAPSPVVTASAPVPPQAGAHTIQTTLDTTNDAVNTVQTTAATVESAVAGVTDAATSTAGTATSQVTSTVVQVPTVPSPLQSPPQNTPLPGLP